MVGYLGPSSYLGLVDVESWKTEEVARWLRGVSESVNASVIALFTNCCTGRRLLLMDNADLAQLGLSSASLRAELLKGIQLLSDVCYNLETVNLQTLALAIAVKARNVANDLLRSRSGLGRFVKYQGKTLACEVQASLNVDVKKFILWLERPPFDQISKYCKVRQTVALKIKALLLDVPQKEELVVPQLYAQCCALAELAECLIREKQYHDPLLLYTCYLERAVLRRDNLSDWGFIVETESSGMASISAVKVGTPASKYLDVGDEIVQINNQVVIGWQPHNVTSLLRASLSLDLVLKKRPHEFAAPSSKSGNTTPRLPVKQLKPKPYLCNSSSPSPSLTPNSPNQNRTETKFPLIVGKVVPTKTRRRSSSVTERESSAPGVSKAQRYRPLAARNESDLPTPPKRKMRAVSVCRDYNLQLEVESICNTLKNQHEAYKVENTPLCRETTETVVVPIADDVFLDDAAPNSFLVVPQEDNGRQRSSSTNLEVLAVTSVESDVNNEWNDPSPHELFDASAETKAFEEKGSSGIKKSVSIDRDTVTTLQHNKEQSPELLSEKLQPCSSAGQDILSRGSVCSLNKLVLSCYLPCGSLGTADHSGWVYKQKKRPLHDPLLKLGVHKKWSKRFLVLKQSYLYIYKNPEDVRADGVIWLAGFFVCPANKEKHGHKQNVFKLARRSEEGFYFRCEHYQDMNIWLNKLGLAAIGYFSDDSNTNDSQSNLYYYFPDEDSHLDSESSRRSSRWYVGSDVSVYATLPRQQKSLSIPNSDENHAKNTSDVNHLETYNFNENINSKTISAGTWSFSPSVSASPSSSSILTLFRTRKSFKTPFTQKPVHLGNVPDTSNF